MLPSGLPELVADDETLARFLKSSSEFNSAGIKSVVFMPTVEDQETSIFRHDNQTLDGFWEIGQQTLPAGRRIHGAAFVQTSSVRALGLDVLADEPPHKHAVIRKWPQCEDPELQKAHHKKIAMEIASKARLLKKV